MRFHALAATALCAFAIHCVHSETTISTVRTYKARDASAGLAEEVEINLEQNVAVFRVASNDTGSESAIVVDYQRNVTGVYNKEAQTCYLTAGVPTSVNSASQLRRSLDTHVNHAEPVAPPRFYRPTGDGPISDLELLPSALQSACAGLPLLRLEPSEAESTAHGDTNDAAVSDAPPASSPLTHRSRRGLKWELSITWTCGCTQVGAKVGNGRRRREAALGEAKVVGSEGASGGWFPGGHAWESPRGGRGGWRERREASGYLCGYVCAVVDVEMICYIACVRL